MGLKLRFERPMGMQTVDGMRQRLLEACAQLGLSDEARPLVVSVADELGGNVIDHSKSTWLELSLEVVEDGGRRAVLILRDDGIPFDPVDALGYYDEPFVVEGSERHMGLWMMKAFAQDLRYERLDNAINQVTYTLPL